MCSVTVGEPCLSLARLSIDIMRRSPQCPLGLFQRPHFFYMPYFLVGSMLPAIHLGSCRDLSSGGFSYDCLVPTDGRQLWYE